MTDTRCGGKGTSVDSIISHIPITYPNIMEPLDKLKQLTAWNIEPELSEIELEDIIAASSLQDIDGLAPTNEEWQPTYDINAAAAQAWLIKAARAAAVVDEPIAGIVTSKIFDNCRAMARLYAGKRNATAII